MRKKSLNKRISALCLALSCALGCAACASSEEPVAPPPAESAALAETPAPAEPAATPEPLDERLLALQLTELMPANESCLPDEDGDFSDWIELYNGGSEAIELGGLWLSDSPRSWDKWQFPARTLEPGEYLLVFCSGKDRHEGKLHTSFSLSGKGETLSLRSASGQLVWERSYEAAGDDVALQHTPDGCVFTREATPGYPNTPEGREAFLRDSDRHGALVLQEVVVYNDDFSWHDGDFYDWVELKNVSDAPLDLSAYTLSDKADERTLFRLPAVTLRPGELFLVYCGKTKSPTAYCHAPFALSAAGDTLYLTDADGKLSDYLGLYDLPLGSSVGRVDGEPGFFYFAKRTPGTDNGTGCHSVAPPPSAEPAQGLYPDAQSLTVTLSGEGTIYYTTNGDLPTAGSKVYTGPIELDASTVIRAVCCVDGKLSGDPVSYSYLLGCSHKLPVVSMACNPFQYRLILDTDTGSIFTADLSFFDGENGFQLGCRYKLHGASSRSYWSKKTMKLNFKNRLGGDLHYDLFGDGRDEYHSILLRGGFTSGMLLFRDSLASLIANEVCPTDPLTLNSRYCVLYVNGKYQGLYAIREAYSPEYVAAHTGCDPESVKILRINARDLSDPGFSESYNYLIGADYSDPASYAHAAELFDMESLAQWLCLESYFCNTDAVGNLRFCQSDADGGKWRTMLFDFDISLGSSAANMDSLLHDDEVIGILLNALQQSPDFRQLTLQTAATLMRNGLNHEHVRETLEALAAQIEEEVASDLHWWGENVHDYRAGLEATLTRLSEQRDRNWLRAIQNYVGASDEEMQRIFSDFQ